MRKIAFTLYYAGFAGLMAAYAVKALEVFDMKPSKIQQVAKPLRWVNHEPESVSSHLQVINPLGECPPCLNSRIQVFPSKNFGNGESHDMG